MAEILGNELMSVEVIRVEKLKPQKFRKYYVKCSIGNETKKAKLITRGSEAALEIPMRLITDYASKLDLRVFVHNVIRRDEFVGGFVKDISELMQGLSLGQLNGSCELRLEQNEELVLALTNLDSSSPRTIDSTVTLRLIQMTPNSDRFNAANVIQDASDNWQRTMDASAALVGGAENVRGPMTIGAEATPLVAFLGNLKPVIDVLDRIAEIHPYAKAAWTIVSAISNVFMSQIDRDSVITDLVNTMNDTYKLVRDGDALQNVMEFKEHFSMMLKQTVECAYFIQSYAKSNFAERAIKAKFTEVDKTIAAYKDSFEQIKTSFRDSISLYTTFSVRRVLEKIDDLTTTVDLNEITYAEGMRFRSESCCLPDTRVDLLDEIIGWANDTGDDSDRNNIFLLTGVAGSGKSSIAHSVASHFEGLHRLGSSFFCTRAKPENSVPEKVLNTIARDIADLDDQIRIKLAEVVKSQRSLCKTPSVREQFNIFIKRPMESLSISGPIVVVIDALDECEGNERLRKELMKILATELTKLPKNFRIFLTARDGDPIITGVFKDAKCVRHYSMQEIGLVSTSADISTFIGYELSSIDEELSNYDKNWRMKLTTMSGGLFIWISTVCRFIIGGVGSAGIDPCDQLEVLLSSEVVAEPLEAINNLYRTVLERCFQSRTKDVMERFRIVMRTILLAYAPLSSDSIADLLGKEAKSRLIISPLGALLTGSNNPKEPVEFLHTSFREFLTNERLGGDFYVDTKGFQTQMAKNCLLVMNKQLKFNLCGLDDLYSLYESMDQDALEARKSVCITDALRYACHYWMSHLVQIGSDDFGEVQEGLNKFLIEEKHAIQWVEAISLFRIMRETLKALRTLLRWFSQERNLGDIRPSLDVLMDSTPSDQRLHIMLNDCFYLLENFSSQICRGPLQVYTAALPYIPMGTYLNRIYQDISGFEPKRLLGGHVAWPTSRSELYSPLRLDYIEFSPDGSRIIGISDEVGGSVAQLWDFTTSETLIEPLDLKGSCIWLRTRAALSPGNGRLAMSTPESIEVWDIIQREILIFDSSFQSDSKLIPVVFLSEDYVIACRCVDTCVESWEADLVNKKTATFSYKTTTLITCTNLSPNGVYIGGLSVFGRVNIWSTQGAQSADPLIDFQLPSFHFEDEIIYYNILAISCDADHVVVASSKRGVVTLWNRSTDSIIWTSDCNNPILEIRMPLSAESSMFASLGRGAVMWDIESGRHYEHLESSFPFIYNLFTVSMDIRYYITARSGNIVVWSLDGIKHDRRRTLIFRKKEGEPGAPDLLDAEHIRQMTFLSDGSISVVSTAYMNIYVYDKLGTKKAVKYSLKSPTSEVLGAKFSSDGRKLLTADEDGNNICVWNRDNYEEEFRLLVHHKIYDRIRAINFFYGPESEWEDYSSSSAATGERIDRSASSDDENNLGNGDGRQVETFFRRSSDGEWVMTAGGRRLWQVYSGYRGRKAEMGKLVLSYNSSAAVLFHYNTAIEDR